MPPPIQSTVFTPNEIFLAIIGLITIAGGIAGIWSIFNNAKKARDSELQAIREEMEKGLELRRLELARSIEDRKSQIDIVKMTLETRIGVLADTLQAFQLKALESFAPQRSLGEMELRVTKHIDGLNKTIDQMSVRLNAFLDHREP